MRRFVLLGALSIACVAACSSNGSSPATTGSGEPTPSPTATTLTAAEAKAAAAAGVLTGSDMPGYTAKAQTQDASDVAAERTERTCLGRPAAHYLARNFGTAFTRGTLEVDSSADVVATASAATSDLQAIGGPKGPTCFKQALRGAVAGSGATVDSISITPQSVTVPDGDGSFAYRISVTITVAGQHGQVTGYEAGARVGPVEIDLSVIAEGQTSLSIAQVSGLLDKAAGRVRTKV